MQAECLPSCRLAVEIQGAVDAPFRDRLTRMARFSGHPAMLCAKFVVKTLSRRRRVLHICRNASSDTAGGSRNQGGVRVGT